RPADKRQAGDQDKEGEKSERRAVGRGHQSLNISSAEMNRYPFFSQASRTVVTASRDFSRCRPPSWNRNTAPGRELAMYSLAISSADFFKTQSVPNVQCTSA